MGSPNLRKPSLQATVGFDCVTMSTLWRFKSWNLIGRSDLLNGLFGGSLPAAEKAKVEEKRHLAVVAQRPQTTVIRGSNIDNDRQNRPKKKYAPRRCNNNKPTGLVYLRRISAEKTSDEGMDSSASIGSVKTKLKRIELVDQSGKSTGMSPEEGAF